MDTIFKITDISSESKVLIFSYKLYSNDVSKGLTSYTFCSKDFLYLGTAIHMFRSKNLLIKQINIHVECVSCNVLTPCATPSKYGNGNFSGYVYDNIQ